VGFFLWYGPLSSLSVKVPSVALNHHSIDNGRKKSGRVSGGKKWKGLCVKNGLKLTDPQPGTL